MIGQTVSHYEITEKIGEGGMGEVYLAEDTSLKRKVALKFLPEYLHADPVAHRRFIREARSAAAIDHPFICNIFEVAQTDDGQDFIVMEYVKGQTLKDKLGSGTVTLEGAIRIASEIAEALTEAHDKGIVHRDLKPSNIMLTPGEHVKVMDFGLAKQLPSEDKGTTESLTQKGTALGTLAYMSPEQVRSQVADKRSDVFALGVVLYELITGVHPFKRDTPLATIGAILHEDHPPLSQHRKGIPDLLCQTVDRMLAKDPSKRYQSLSEVKGNLDGLGEASQLLPSLMSALTRPPVAIPLVLFTIFASFLVYQFSQRFEQQRWAREEGIPEVIRLTEQQDYIGAFRLAEELEQWIPKEPKLIELWEDISVVRSIETAPESADVYVKGYRDLRGDWWYLGKSPIKDIRLPRDLARWRVEKEGFNAIEVAVFTENVGFFSLDQEGSIPPEMVLVKGGQPMYVALTGLEHIEPLQLGRFLIDRYEVTNKQFKEFVDAGGYRQQEYWKHPFTKEGKALSWQEAMKGFVDETGRAGPATWELGDYPEGQDNYPVTGVSWYEAAAYADFAGKNLPTIYHWSYVAGHWISDYIVSLSNFEGEGPRAVGSLPAMSRIGANDMAGNVKEWCQNSSGEKRFILGGAWNEPEYMFLEPDAQDPFDRLPTYGFRCVKYLSEVTDAAVSSLTVSRRDFSNEKPVSEEIFAIYERLYSYDKGDLNASIESIEESGKHWRKETVSFEAAYGEERVSAFLLLPRNTDPPYQVVVYFPGASAVFQRSSERFRFSRVDFFLRSGRAVICPIFKGTYERGSDIKGDVPNLSNTYRDHVIMWSKDLGRALDYLETRPEISSEKIAYFGWSWGGSLGAILPALEQRLKVSVLVSGGFYLQEVQPEADPLNFAPRVTIPTLMLNGRHDFFFHIDSSQEPMFRSLGTPREHKRHVIFETGHSIPRPAIIRETLAWLDRYLGPVH